MANHGQHPPVEEFTKLYRNRRCRIYQKRDSGFCVIQYLNGLHISIVRLSELTDTEEQREAGLSNTQG